MVWFDDDFHMLHLIYMQTLLGGNLLPQFNI
jgi:hypothetical protein